MIVLVDIQHYGQPGENIDSRGAGADIDGDGTVETWEREAELTPMYGHGITLECVAKGWRAGMLPSGFTTYKDRAQQAIEIAKANPADDVVVLLCHLNAGGSDYALTGYLDTRPNDKLLADAIADELGALPEIGDGKHFACQASPHWTHRMRYCLQGYADAPGNLYVVLLEPWFIDNPTHQALAGSDGPIRVARAIVNGIEIWGRHA